MNCGLSGSRCLFRTRGSSVRICAFPRPAIRSGSFQRVAEWRSHPREAMPPSPFHCGPVAIPLRGRSAASYGSAPAGILPEAIARWEGARTGLPSLSHRSRPRKETCARRRQMLHPPERQEEDCREEQSGAFGYRRHRNTGFGYPCTMVEQETPILPQAGSGMTREASK